MIQDWKPTVEGKRPSGGMPVAWRRVQLCYAPANKLSALGAAIAQGEVALHIATERQTGNDFWLTLQEIQMFLNGKPTKYVSLRSLKNPSAHAVPGVFTKPIDDQQEIDAIVEMALTMKP